MPERIHDSYEYPTDLAEDGDGAGALRWTVGIIVTTAALLALMNAAAISGWAASFDPKPSVIAVMQAADGWTATTDRLGLGTPRARLHQLWKHAESARWTERKNPRE